MADARPRLTPDGRTIFGAIGQGIDGVPSPPLNVIRSYLPDLLIDALAREDAEAPERAPRVFPAALMFADISGSTDLTKRIAGEDAIAIEGLSRVLNDYFGKLIDVVLEHGGDVIKFAGDALMAIWPSREGDLEHETRLAAGCALAVQARLEAASFEVHPMATRIAVSAGEVTAMHLGGVRDRWEFIVTGRPLADLGTVKYLVQPGRVVVSAPAWELIEPVSQGEPLEKGAVELAALETVRRQPGQRAEVTERFAKHMETYLPGAIRSRIAAGQAAWLAELRRVTVLFVMLPSLTEPASTQIAQTITSRMQDVLYEREGSINKLSEDDNGVSLLAAFGLPPYAHRDDAGRGVDAALALAAMLEDLGVEASMGVATGSAFCGSVGNTLRREYSMIGDVVNVAARLAQAAAQDHPQEGTVTVLCDDATHQAASPGFEFGPVSKIAVKGIADPINSSRPIRPGVTLRPKSVLVGREREKSLLTDFLDGAGSGGGATLILEGEPGIGKTRLAEFVAETALRRGMRTFLGGADSIQRTAPYHAWRRVFSNILLSTRGAIGSDALPEIEVTLRRLAPGQKDLAPLLNPILAVDFPETELTETLTAEARAEATSELLTEMLVEATGGKPAVVLLEDGHWFDSASWRLARHIRRSARRLLLVITTRPLGEPTPPEYRLMIEEDATVVTLNGLSPPNIERLVADRLGVEQVPADLTRLIVDRTDGHPFFAEELTLALRDGGMIVLDNGRSRLRPGAELDIPTSVWGVIAERIDGLPPESQLTLKVASVIGRTFPFRVLENVHPMDEYRPRLPEHLDLLARLDLTPLLRREPDLAYIFKHDLTQEVAYELMPEQQRQQIHQSVATWYERTSGDDVEQAIPLLAHHWSSARVFPKAIEYLVRAGRQALGSGAYTEAIRNLKMALDINQEEQLVDDPLELAEWHFLIGTGFRSGGHLKESLGHHLQVLELLGRPQARVISFGLASQAARQLITRLFSTGSGSKNGAADQLAALTYEELYPIYYHLVEPTRTLYSVLRNVNLAERASAAPQLARSYAAMASTAGYSSLHSLAERYIALAYDQLQRGADRTDRGRVNQLVHIYRAGVGGRWEETEEIATEALRLFEPLGDRRWLENLSLLSVIGFYRGQLDRARAMSEDMYAEAFRRGDPQMQVIGRCEQAQIALHEGRLADAADHLDIPKDLAAIQGRNELIWMRGLQALLAFRQGDTDQALAHALTGHALTKGLPLGYYALEGYSAIAEVLLGAWEKGAGSDANPRRLVSRSVKAIRRFGRTFPIGIPRARLWRGEYLWLRGRQKAARRVWERGLVDAVDRDLVYDEAALRFHVARRLERDDPQRTEHLTRAATLLSAMGASFHLDRVRTIDQDDRR